jgi:hypothetical protein
MYQFNQLPGDWFPLSCLGAELHNELFIQLIRVQVMMQPYPFQEVLYHLVGDIMMISFIEIQPSDGLYERYGSIFRFFDDGYDPLPPFCLEQNIEQKGNQCNKQSPPRGRVAPQYSKV